MTTFYEKSVQNIVIRFNNIHILPEIINGNVDAQKSLSFLFFQITVDFSDLQWSVLLLVGPKCHENSPPTSGQYDFGYICPTLCTDYLPIHLDWKRDRHRSTLQACPYRSMYISMLLTFPNHWVQCARNCMEEIGVDMAAALFLDLSPSMASPQASSFIKQHDVCTV